MPPILNLQGILSVEIHDVELSEVQDLFGRFQRTSRRPTLFQKLEAYIIALRGAGIPGNLIIDGSFVMGCVDEPEYIDVVLVLANTWDMTKNLNPFQYNLVSKKVVKRNYRIEVFIALQGSDAETSWTDFFYQINPKRYANHGFAVDSKKGLLRVAL